MSPAPNRAILVEFKGIKYIVSLLPESETTGLFYNAQVAIPEQRMHNAISYKQPATPMKMTTLKF